MGISFEIHFDGNPAGVFSSGSDMSGKAILNVDRTMSIKGIQIRIYGVAKVKWEEDDDYQRDKERYFDSLTYCSSHPGGNPYPLEPGQYTFAFKFSLPLQCPSSFEGKYGHIRYSATIIILESSFLVPNRSYSKEFLVLQTFDLNRVPSLRGPVSLEVIKNLSSFSGGSNRVCLVVSLPQTGFVPGEAIPIKGKIVSQRPSASFYYVKFELRRKVKYNIKNSTSRKKEENVLAKTCLGPFEGAKIECNYQLIIPPTPTNCENTCRMINIKYQLEITLAFSGLHSSKTISIPISLGSIPFIT